MASREADIEICFQHVVEQTKALAPDSQILLRRPKINEPNLIEQLVDKIAAALGLDTVWFSPEGEGRAATFHRDFRMVEAADTVIAYFSPERVMEGGTGHVVEAALIREVPVFAWVVDGTGVTRLGEIELSDITHA